MTVEKYKDNYQQFPKLDAMKKLWHAGYWDGPLSGMCSVDGQKCWFQCIEEWDEHNDYPEDEDEFEQPWYRRFLIYRLTEEQLLPTEAGHDKFCRMVGTHCNYDEDGVTRGRFHYNDTVTPDTFEQYYKEAKENKEPQTDMTPVSDEHIIGWYEW
jgi:hypothetical protein